MWTPSGFSFLVLLLRGDIGFVYFFSLVCFFCNKLWIWYVQVKLLGILQLTYVHPLPQKHRIFFHQLLVIVPWFCIYRIFIINHHRRNNNPPFAHFSFWYQYCTFLHPFSYTIEIYWEITLFQCIPSFSMNSNFLSYIVLK